MKTGRHGLSDRAPRNKQHRIVRLRPSGAGPPVKKGGVACWPASPGPPRTSTNPSGRNRTTMTHKWPEVKSVREIPGLGRDAGEGRGSRTPAQNACNPLSDKVLRNTWGARDRSRPPAGLPPKKPRPGANDRFRGPGPAETAMGTPGPGAEARPRGPASPGCRLLTSGAIPYGAAGRASTRAFADGAPRLQPIRMAPDVALSLVTEFENLPHARSHVVPDLIHPEPLHAPA